MRKHVETYLSIYLISGTIKGENFGKPYHRSFHRALVQPATYEIIYYTESLNFAVYEEIIFQPTRGIIKVLLHV